MFTTNIRVAAEYGNEMFPNRARLDGNIISHAVTNGITEITATPASMSILLCIVEEDLTELFESQGGEIVTIDNYCNFYIGDNMYNYHLDYPIIISKKILANNKSVYTARYDTSYPNKLSNINNPYLPSPYIMRFNGMNYLYLACDIRQTDIEVTYNKLITASSIDNKTYEFTFENQLACFDVYITEGDETVRLTPLLEGEPTVGIVNYCWYSYLDTNTIRVKFDADSYMPDINAEIKTVAQTTLGSECKFEYTENILTTLNDTERFSYLAKQIMIIPQTASDGGVDKKTTSELKSLITKEASSRGGLTSDSDLNDFFNRLNTSNLRLNFNKKVDNQIMMQYYGYILAKDSDNNVVPTNTLDIIVKESDLESIIYNRNEMLIVRQGFCFGCNIGGNLFAETLSDTSQATLDLYDFVYTLPFKAIIDKSVPCISYYVTIMNNTYKTYFEFINDNAPLQFICANVKWTRPYQGSSKNTYTMSFTVLQNVDSDEGVIVQDEEGNVPTDALYDAKLEALKPPSILEEDSTKEQEPIQGFVVVNGQTIYDGDYVEVTSGDSASDPIVALDSGDSDLSDDNSVQVIFNNGSSLITHPAPKPSEGSNNLVCIAVCYKNKVPYRYFTSKLTTYNMTEFTFDQEITFDTDDIVDTDNNIRISNGYAAEQFVVEHGYLEPNTEVYLYILCRFYDKNDNPISYGRYNLDDIVKLNLKEFTVTNVYKIIGGIDFYDNFSDYVSTIVTPTTVNDEPAFKLTSVPLIKYTYSQDEDKFLEFINKLKLEKDYISSALTLLQNPFTVDIKFYNTYGQARSYTLDDSMELLDRVNISLSFRVALKKASDDYTIEYIKRDIKEYIEPLDKANLDHHIPNLIAELYNTYSNSIYYIEYRGFNNYGTEYQHLYAPDSTDIGRVPEFININQTSENLPDITIKQM